MASNLLVVAELFCRLAKEESTKTGDHNDLSAMKLMQLIYVAHAIKLVVTDKPLILDAIEAWTRGPVMPRLCNHIRKYYKGPPIEHIRGVTDEDIALLDEVDREYIDECFIKYGKRSTYGLESITNSYLSPWHNIYNNIDDLRDNVIKDDDIKKYYKIEKYILTNNYI